MLPLAGERQFRGCFYPLKGERQFPVGSAYPLAAERHVRHPARACPLRGERHFLTCAYPLAGKRQFPTCAYPLAGERQFPVDREETPLP